MTTAMPHTPDVSLRPVNADNWRQCADLAVAPEQRSFLPPNADSFAAARLYPDSECRAVYAGNQMVGFAMYGIQQGTGRAKVFRLMIVAGFQRRGYGAAALDLVLRAITNRWRPSAVYVSFEADNHAARRLYERFGFGEVERAGNRVTARKPFD